MGQYKYCFHITTVAGLHERVHADGFRISIGGALSLFVESAPGIEKTIKIFAPGYWFRVDIEEEK